MAIYEGSDTENNIKLVLRTDLVGKGSYFTPAVDVMYKLVSDDTTEIFDYSQINNVDAQVNTESSIRNGFWQADTVVRQNEGMNIIEH